jgi:hypothetical protein
VAPLLVVVKRFGRAGLGHLSFAIPGHSLVINLSAAAGALALLDRVEGMSAERFARMYPRLPAFRQVLAEIDPTGCSAPSSPCGCVSARHPRDGGDVRAALVTHGRATYHRRCGSPSDRRACRRWPGPAHPSAQRPHPQGYAGSRGQTVARAQRRAAARRARSAGDRGAIARELGAIVHSQPLRGYGDTLRTGMDVATGDILVLVEADRTFGARDLGKLLEYLKDADMVIGTRTTRQMIAQSANMDGLLRWGNVAVGKLIEALWWSLEPRLTDVGCTYRALWRDAYRRIRPYLTQDGPAFSPEMMIEVLRMEGRLIEIPVNYYRRRGGVSKHSTNRWQSMRTGLRMLNVR